VAPAIDGDEDYRAFAARLTATGILSDPWCDGRPRFSARPLVLGAAQHRALVAAAEAMAAAYNEAALLCARDPSLIDAFFAALTPFQRLMWTVAAPAWHAIARADVFWTAEGARVCELNCDTPSGEAEAVLLNQAVHAAHPALVDPNCGLGARLCDVVAALAPEGARPPYTVGIIYPTELVEDLSMISLYQQWLMERGFRVVLGSPFNLRRVRGRAALFDVPCDLFIRHYKTDWWSEREPVWDDDGAFADPQPLASELRILLDGVLEGSCAVVNPFGAVLMQNKRIMALMCEAIERFSPAAQAAIRSYLPYTTRLESLEPAALADRVNWVLKSDYGCEGDEVILGSDVDEATWAAALGHAVKGRWIAQRRFWPLTDEHGASVNYGVYTVGGEFAGYFSRVQRGATDYHAVAAATLLGGDHG
jgi:glutathionylspermidine synthase